jgi:small subunit ribosomal protein S17
MTTEQSAPTPSRGERKVRQGVVVSDKMDKTVVVEIRRRTTHPLYRKIINRTEKLHAHDETNDVRTGDRVRVAETRPLSKTKRWRVVEVLERAR